MLSKSVYDLCVSTSQQTMVTQMSCPVMNSRVMTAEEYFNPNPSHIHRDIGQPSHLTTKTQRCLNASQLSHTIFEIISSCVCVQGTRSPRELFKGKSLFLFMKQYLLLHRYLCCHVEFSFSMNQHWN